MSTSTRTPAGEAARRQLRARRSRRRASGSPSTLASTPWPRSRVILHGGEPLLAGAARLGEIAAGLRAAHHPRLRARPADPHQRRAARRGVLRGLRRAGVKVGISLDGDRAGNDRHRRYRDGRSSYDQVIRAVGCCGPTRTAPLRGAAVHHRRRQRPGRGLRRAGRRSTRRGSTSCSRTRTWDTPAARGRHRRDAVRRLAAAVFDRWLADGRRCRCGCSSRSSGPRAAPARLTESLGLEASDVAVIETDGTIEQADSIKVAYDGAPGHRFRHLRATPRRGRRAPGHPGQAARPRRA